MNGYCAVHGLPVLDSAGKCEDCFVIGNAQTIPITTKEWTYQQQRIIDLESQLTAANAEIERLKATLDSHKMDHTAKFVDSSCNDPQLTAANAEIERLLVEGKKACDAWREELTAAKQEIENLKHQPQTLTSHIELSPEWYKMNEMLTAANAKVEKLRGAGFHAGRCSIISDRHYDYCDCGWSQALTDTEEK